MTVLLKVFILADDVMKSCHRISWERPLMCSMNLAETIMSAFMFDPGPIAGPVWFGPVLKDLNLVGPIVH